jgi:hypothetical protein
MDREKLDILLLDFWQGESLSDEEKQEIRLWLDEDEANRRYYKRLVRDYLRQRWTMRTGLIRRKEERRYRRVAKRRILFRRVATVAAAVCFLLVSGVCYNYWMRERKTVKLLTEGKIEPGVPCAQLMLSSGKIVALGKEKKAIRERQEVAIFVNEEGSIAYQDSLTGAKGQEPEYNKLVVNRGGEFNIVLSDSSVIWVNSATELEYPIRFVGNERVVKLRGEAYFKVKADSLHPFIVDVDGLEIRALGTEFNVNTRKKDKVESVLVKGEVDVRKGNCGAELHPNQLAIYDLQVNRIVVADVDVRKYIAWKDGDFVFSDDRLEDVMDKISLWYDCHVFYVDPSLKDVRLSGDMKRYGKIEELLHFLKLSTGANFEVKGKTIFISSM